MATYFGEVLPVLSRAVDDDDDDDEEPVNGDTPKHSLCFVNWTPETLKEIKESPEERLKCSTVLIAHGQNATAFCQVHIMSQSTRCLGVISSGIDDKHNNTLSQSSVTDKTCYMYCLAQNKEVIIVMCNTVVTPEQSYSWTNELFKHLSLKNTYVAVLTSVSVNEYRCDTSTTDLQTPFLRALRTEPFKGTPLCPYLEQPNSLSGLPAQVMSYCKVHKMAAVLYGCYVESTLFLEPNALQMFKKVLSSTPFRDICVKNPKESEEINKLVDVHSDVTALYI